MNYKIQKSIDQIDDFFGVQKGIKVTRAIRNKAKIAISDIKSKEIYKNDESLQNLIDVVNDVLKASAIGTGYILIPGSVILFPFIRKALQKSKIEKIRKILELTVEKDIK
jgi:hypothetical protein